MKKCYVVVLKWAQDYETGVEVIAVKSTEAQAQEALAKEANKEKELADQKGWVILANEPSSFEAGVPGYWVAYHVEISIHEVEEKEDDNEAESV